MDLFVKQSLKCWFTKRTVGIIPKEDQVYTFYEDGVTQMVAASQFCTETQHNAGWQYLAVVSGAIIALIFLWHAADPKRYSEDRNLLIAGAVFVGGIGGAFLPFVLFGIYQTMGVLTVLLIIAAVLFGIFKAMEWLRAGKKVSTFFNNLNLAARIQRKLHEKEESLALMERQLETARREIPEFAAWERTLENK